VTNEPAGLVEKTVAERGIRYPIARVSGGAADTAYGIEGFPTVILVAPSGEVAWIGHGSAYESLIPALLEEVAFVPPLKGREHAPINKLLDKRDFGAAWKKVVAALEKVPGDAELGACRDALERALAARLESARSRREARRFAQALATYEDVAQRFAGMPGAEDAAAAARAIAEDAEAKDDLAANEMYLKAKAERAKDKKASRENAERLLDKLLEQYPATATAERVRAARGKG